MLRPLDLQDLYREPMDAVAVLARPPAYFRSTLNLSFERDHDELDWFEAAVVQLRDRSRAAFLQYRGQPRHTTTVYLPRGSRPERDRAALDDLLEEASLAAGDVEWLKPGIPTSRQAHVALSSDRPQSLLKARRKHGLQTRFQLQRGHKLGSRHPSILERRFERR